MLTTRPSGSPRTNPGRGWSVRSWSPPPATTSPSCSASQATKVPAGMARARYRRSAASSSAVAAWSIAPVATNIAHRWYARTATSSSVAGRTRYGPSTPGFEGTGVAA